MKANRSTLLLFILILAVSAHAGDPAAPSSAPARSPQPQWTTTTTNWDSGDLDYDGSGNIIHVGDDQYAYDAVGRLLSATANIPPTPPETISTHLNNAQAYTYDRYGNLLTITTNSGGLTSADALLVNGGTNQLTGTVCPPNTFCHTALYDAAGNQTGSPGVTQYTWDAVGTMTELNLSSRHEQYIYDASDERIVVIEQPSGIQRYTLRGTDAKVIREVAYNPQGSSWTWARDYVYRNGTLLAEYVAGESGAGPQRHYHVDHLGTPRLITDGGGNKLSIHTYWPFGVEAPGSQIDAAERMKFTGHERDSNPYVPAQDLDYMHARYYRALEGRFLSVDPARESSNPKMPQSWNRYTYALNNPVLYTDPDGRCAGVTVLPCPGWLISGGRAAVAGAGARTAGAAAGPIGLAVANAAITGWQIGRGIGTSTVGGKTIDSRVTDLFVKGIELGISLSENTAHGEERENDPDRQVDIDKVKANGEEFIDTETGARVFVLGGSVVLIGDGGKVSQWNTQTKKETNKRVRDGKWERVPKDAREPEIR